MKKRNLIKCHAKSSSKQESPNSEQQEDNPISLSAELLRTIISLVFEILSLFCALFSILGVLYTICMEWFSIPSILGILNSLVVFPQYVFTILYFYTKGGRLHIKRIQSFFTFLSLCILFIYFLLVGFIQLPEFCSLLIITNLAAILFSLFFSIYKEISNEKNKDYIVNYFSALTAFAALIVSLIALIKA